MCVPGKVLIYPRGRLLRSRCESCSRRLSLRIALRSLYRTRYTYRPGLDTVKGPLREHTRTQHKQRQRTSKSKWNQGGSRPKRAAEGGERAAVHAMWDGEHHSSAICGVALMTDCSGDNMQGLNRCSWQRLSQPARNCQLPREACEEMLRASARSTPEIHFTANFPVNRCEQSRFGHPIHGFMRRVSCCDRVHVSRRL